MEIFAEIILVASLIVMVIAYAFLLGRLYIISGKIENLKDKIKELTAEKSVVIQMREEIEEYEKENKSALLNIINSRNERISEEQRKKAQEEK